MNHTVDRARHPCPVDFSRKKQNMNTYMKLRYRSLKISVGGSACCARGDVLGFQASIIHPSHYTVLNSTPYVFLELNINMQ